MCIRDSIKNVDEHGNKRYDFQFENKRGYKVTIEGLSEKFNKEYWNYAKLISCLLYTSFFFLFIYNLGINLSGGNVLMPQQLANCCLLYTSFQCFRLLLTAVFKIYH